jgi:hypothetical protein
MVLSLSFFEDAGRRAFFTALAVALGSFSQLALAGGLAHADRHAYAVAALAALGAGLSFVAHAVLDPILQGRVKQVGGGLVGMMLLTAAQAYGGQVIAQLDSASPFDAKAWSALAVSVLGGVGTLLAAWMRQGAHDGPAPGLPSAPTDAQDSVPLDPALDGDDRSHAK